MSTTNHLPYDAYEIDPSTSEDEHPLKVLRMGSIDGVAVWGGVFEDGPLKGRGVLVGPSAAHGVLAGTVPDPGAGFTISIPLWRVISVVRKDARQVERGVA